MYGRLPPVASRRELAELFDLPAIAVEDVAPHPPDDIVPGRKAPVVLSEGGRIVRAMGWGLIPSWSTKPAGGPRPLYARSDTASDNATFRDPYRRRRCLVPATGFYGSMRDPSGSGGPKVPYLFRPADGGPVAFAGLWDRLGDDASETFSILTRPPYASTAPARGRPPLILPPELFDPWLDEDLTAPTRIAAVLKRAGEVELTATAVSDEGFPQSEVPARRRDGRRKPRRPRRPRLRNAYWPPEGERSEYGGET